MREVHVFCCCLDKALNTLFRWRWLIVFMFSISLVIFYTVLGYWNSHYGCENGSPPWHLSVPTSPRFPLCVLSCALSRILIHTIYVLDIKVSFGRFCDFLFFSCFFSFFLPTLKVPPYCFLTITVSKEMLTCSIVPSYNKWDFFLYLKHAFHFHHLDYKEYA